MPPAVPPPSPSAALDPQVNAVVEACAGSGKTWLLVSRMLRLLLAGAAPSELLAITFTRKAAEEMGERLNDWLALMAAAPDDEVVDFLVQRGLYQDAARAALPRARRLQEEVLLACPGPTITTFHGWFLRLLERAPLPDRPPANLMEDLVLLRREAWRVYSAALVVRPDSPEGQALAELLLDIPLASLEQWLFGILARRAEWWAWGWQRADPLADALADLEARAGLTEGRPLAEEMWGEPGFRSDLLEYLGLVEREAASLATAADRAASLAAVLAGGDGLGDGASPPKATSQTQRLLSVFLTQAGEIRSLKVGPSLVKRLGEADAHRYGELHQRLGERLVACQAGWGEQAALRHNRLALTLALPFLDHFQRLKSERNGLDFTDAEWQAWRLMADPELGPALMARLDVRWKHLLLDEFQDTNPLQWQTLREWLAAYGADGQRPSLFLVGDPKQSIYRFRRAEPRLFDEARAFLQAHYQAVHLANHITRRLAPRVAAWVDGVFLDRDDYPGYQVHQAFQANLPGLCELIVQPRAGAEAAEPPGEWRAPLAQAPTSPPAPRALEAAAVADRIQALVGHLAIGSGSAVRPAGYGDIFVLTASRSELATFEAALKARGIPFVTSRRGGLLDTLEAGDLLALLTWLTSPGDDLSLARLLKSPLFGCDDDGLLALSRRDGPTWWARLAGWDEAPGPLGRAAGLLADWLDRAGREPAHDLLDHIFHAGDLEARYAAAVPPTLAPGVLANLRAVLALSLQTAGGRYPSLTRLRAELEARRRDAGDEAPDEPPAQAGDCVRLLTIHAAKGLEAPVVFLIKADQEGRDTDHYGALLDWPVTAPRPAHFSTFGTKDTRGRARDELFQREEDQDRRERLNLLYVAMTRARQALIISGLETAKAGTWLALAREGLERACQAGLEALPAMAWDAAAASPPPSAGDAGPGPTPIHRPLGKRVASESAEAALGTLVHRHLELATLGQPRPTAAAGEDVARELADRMLASPALAPFLDPGRYRAAHNELEYVDATGQRRRIDRLVEFDQEVWVLDYKTGGLSEPDLARRAEPHLVQMADYRAAMAHLYPGKPIRCALLFGDGQLYEVPANT